jgi:hypothetical protein
VVAAPVVAVVAVALLQLRVTNPSLIPISQGRLRAVPFCFQRRLQLSKGTHAGRLGNVKRVLPLIPTILGAAMARPDDPLVSKLEFDIRPMVAGGNFTGRPCAAVGFREKRKVEMLKKQNGL